MADHPMSEHTMGLLRDVGYERVRQQQLWGKQECPDMPAKVAGPANAYFGIPTEAAGKQLCQDAFRRGLGSFGHILLEEITEAYAAIGDDRALRAELVQVAAVAIQWCEAIDRRRCAAKQEADQAGYTVPEVPHG